MGTGLQWPEYDLRLCFPLAFVERPSPSDPRAFARPFLCLDCCCSRPPFLWLRLVHPSGLSFSGTASEKPFGILRLRAPVNILKANLISYLIFSFLI